MWEISVSVQLGKQPNEVKKWHLALDAQVLRTEVTKGYDALSHRIY